MVSVPCGVTQGTGAYHLPGCRKSPACALSCTFVMAFSTGDNAWGPFDLPNLSTCCGLLYFPATSHHGTCQVSIEQPVGRKGHRGAHRVMHSCLHVHAPPTPGTYEQPRVESQALPPQCCVTQTLATPGYYAKSKPASVLLCALPMRIRGKKLRRHLSSNHSLACRAQSSTCCIDRTSNESRWHV